MKIIVADNSTLSNFARLGVIDPLFVLFEPILICHGVEREVKEWAGKYPFLQMIAGKIEEGKILVEREESPEMLFTVAELQQKYRKLSIADAASIALAHHKKLPLSIDELAGIKAAEAYGVQILTTKNIFQAWNDALIFTPNELNALLDRFDRECIFNTMGFRF